MLLWFVAAIITFVTGISAHAGQVRFFQPTKIYDHRVLGRIPQYLGVELERGDMVYPYKLPEGYVFEDIAPRVADLDGDGVPEIITVRSSLTLGSSMVILKLVDGKLQIQAATPEIGQSQRWLAIAGVGDFDADGHENDIAYVETPHLGRVLRFWRYVDGMLVNIGNVGGQTNHFIGDEFITGGVRNCGERDEVVTIDPSSRLALATKIRRGEIVVEALAMRPELAILCMKKGI